ncbi:hypothetical protein A2W13_03005 [Candidatus Woesebacteria bacterium RBG_16_36_11]|uniref:DUF3850 domain-containing protein n=1 Tax=Candidatus Woesebacteria bacterium RBG_16_36_11 TaxID=1802481 RepID=A0A1F7XAB2_9BACT|nr:MAG: hypothetical protein A2W13_03005 [Candidatus Woesebacteria bacterium RBG_16_36_11]
MIVKKKIPPKYFDLISSGKKKFELRVADFDIKVGDMLILEEYDPKKKKYTGRKMKKKVGYKLHFSLNQFGQKDLIEKKGLYILQLED